MSEVQTLLEDIERFIAAREMAPSTFGRKAVNDGKLVDRLKEGASITLATAAKIRAFLASAPPLSTTSHQSLDGEAAA